MERAVQAATATDEVTQVLQAPASADRRSATAVALHPDGRPAQVARFTWHFVQMVVAMMLGMVPLVIVLALLGVSNLSRSRPELFASVMSVSMVVPMAAWMRFRMGHSRARTTEMSAAMLLPVAVVVPLCLVGVLPHSFAVGPTHVLMPLAMLADMGYRWPDYARHRH